MKARRLSAVSWVVFGCASLLGQTSVTIGGSTGSSGVSGAINVSTPTTTVNVVGSVTAGGATGSVSVSGPGFTPITPIDPSLPSATPVTPINPPIVAATSDARITNLSTRARVASDLPLITGFAITGSGARTLLVRAVGPTLGTFGVDDTLAAPRLKIHDATGAVMLENAGWGANPLLTTATAVAGAFPFAAGSADSAVVVTLPPGTYSVEVSDDAGRGGVVLTEIYDIEKSSAGSRLSNVSTRNNVAPAGGEFISGFVVSGTQPREFLVRGVGPALTRFNVTGVLADPALTLFNTSGTPIATNDNWSGFVQTPTPASIAAAAAAAAAASAAAAAAGTVAVAVPQTATIAAVAGAVSVATVAPAAPNPTATATARAGAFGLDVGSTDAAMVVSLNPGAYTVQVSAANNAAAKSGTALLEIYELP